MAMITRLADLQSELQKDMPGVYLREDPGRMLLELGVVVRSQMDVLAIPTGEEERYLKYMVERLRLVGIRELGLTARMEAYDREAQEFRQANRLLNDQLAIAQRKVGELQLELIRLQEDEGDGE